MIIVRYADDIVVGFEKEADARHFWEAMRARLAEFALSLKVTSGSGTIRIRFFYFCIRR